MTTSRSLFVAIGLALLGIILINSYVTEYKNEILHKYGEPQPVVVANQEIKEYAVINEKMVRIEKIPRDYIQPNAARDIEDVINTVAKITIKEGEQLQQNKLTSLGSESGLQHQVNVSKRAVSIPVNDISGVGKLIKPGNRVDVISSIDYGDGVNENREVRTILQDLLVLAAGRYVTNNIPRIFYRDIYTKKIQEKELNIAYEYRSITVEVSPVQAQTLVFLLTSGEGNIYLSLRNSKDNQQIKLGSSNVDIVLGPDSIKAKRSLIKKRPRTRWEEIRGNAPQGGFY